MKRMLVVVVDNTDKAYEGATALERLSEESTVGLHDSVVVTKNSDGTIAVVRTYETDPEATMGGTAVGSMIGVLGGPVGLAVGAASGFVIGAATDIVRARVGRDFVKDVADALVPGKTALVAEIDEDDTDPVDARMQPLGGTIFRREFRTWPTRNMHTRSPRLRPTSLKRKPNAPQAAPHARADSRTEREVVRQDHAADALPFVLVRCCADCLCVSDYSV
jgi:uncharacterized membrane protein